METTIDTIKRTFIDSKLGEVKLKDAVLDRDEITMYFNIESLSDESPALPAEAHAPLHKLPGLLTQTIPD